VKTERGALSPDCVSANDYELGFAFCEDFTNFALCDPAASEIFGLPRDVIDDINDPLSIMHENTFVDAMEPFPQETAGEEFPFLPEYGSVESPTSHDAVYTDEAFLNCMSSDFGNELEYPYTPAVDFEKDQGSSMSTCTECDEVLESVDELCANDDVLRGEIAMLKTMYVNPEQGNAAATLGLEWSEEAQYPIDFLPGVLPPYTIDDCLVDELPVLHAEAIDDIGMDQVAQPVACPPEDEGSFQLVVTM
jgi:hypothetical protein